MHFNNRGFSFIETMVGLGIMVAFSLGMASMISNVVGQAKRQEAKVNVISSKSELLVNVQANNACTSTLSGQTVDNGAPLIMGPIYTGAKIGPRVEVSDVAVTGVTTIDALTNSKSATISVQFRDTHDSNNSFKPLEFILYYKTDAANSLISCGGGGQIEDLQAGCVSVGGAWNSVTNSCDINSGTCRYLGGTLNADGTCTDLPVVTSSSPPPASLSSCTGTTFPSTDSIYPRTQTDSRCLRPGRAGCMGSSIKYYNVASSCTVSGVASGLVASGTCNGKSPTGGSCRYQCYDGSWSLLFNDCNERE